MSDRRVLVAASTGIVCEPWVQRKVEVALAGGLGKVIQLGRNQALTKALEKSGVSFSQLPGAGRSPTRSEIRKALCEADHLLLLWDGRTLTELLFEARLRGLPTKVYPIEVTEVVNRDRGDTFDAYVGRGTPWGNPFHVGKQEGQFEREEAIEKFREHFNRSIVPNSSLRRGLLSLRGLRIACHCKPLACHADVIAAYLNSLDPGSLEAEGKVPISAAYRFERDPQSVFGFLTTNRASTEACNVLEKWQLQADGRTYEVIRDEQDSEDTLEARLSFALGDSLAEEHLEALCLEHGVRRARLPV